MLQQKSIRSFLIPYFILFGIAVVSLLFLEKGDVVYWVNERATNFWDVFFQWETILGTPEVYIPVVVICLFKRYDHSLLGVFAILVSFIFSYILKEEIFHETLRPTGTFPMDSFPHIMPDFNYHQYYSFPSGHTIITFTLMLYTAIIVDKKWFSALMLFLAILTGFSRIYLLQHFYMDVVAGSFVGVIAVFIAYPLNKKLANRFPNLKGRIQLNKNNEQA